MKKLLLFIIFMVGCDYAPTEHTHEHTHDHEYEVRSVAWILTGDCISESGSIGKFCAEWTASTDNYYYYTLGWSQPADTFGVYKVNIITHFVQDDYFQIGSYQHYILLYPGDYTTFQYEYK